MGCDIHMYVEYRKKVNEKLVWISGDYFRPNAYYGQWEGEEQMSRMELHGHRNYNLFSTLAGVRDYTDNVKPVSEPKGIPEDATEYVKKENERWDSDGHNHSWLTLGEIREYQKRSPVMYYTGLLSPEALKAFDEHGTLPQSWCQGTNQPGFERREWSEPNKLLIPLIAKLEQRAKDLLQSDWDDSYDQKNDDNIRIVFWFDN